MQTHLKLECQTSFSSERLSTYLSACYGDMDIDQIRELRNRIAHHEPIFQRDLLVDYQNIRNFLSASQSPSFMDWLDSHQTISLIATRIMR